jgi:hypothetical protein
VSAYVSLAARTSSYETSAHTPHPSAHSPHTSAYVSLAAHTSSATAYAPRYVCVCIRQRICRIRPHTSAYVSVTSSATAYAPRYVCVCIRQRIRRIRRIRPHTSR